MILFLVVVASAAKLRASHDDAHDVGHQQVHAFKESLEEKFGHKASVDQIVDKVWDFVDANHDGKVSEQELVDASNEACKAAHIDPTPEQTVRDLFSKFNKSGDELNREEFKNLITYVLRD